MSLIKAKAPRFYHERDGVVEACYTMPKKDGKGMKEPNITDARKLGLLPSVTTILGIMARPGLERWKKEQVIYSAITLPMEREDFVTWKNRAFNVAETWIGAGVDNIAYHAYHTPPAYTETEDEFAARVVEDSEAQAAKAAEFGNRIHDAIADWLTTHGDGQLYSVDGEVFKYLASFRDWVNGNIEKVHAVEKVVGGKHCGYAGRLDLDCTLKGIGRTICDFKSQGIKEGESPIFYEDQWLPQLCGYRDACTDCVPRIMSLVIDSRAPGPVWPKLWGFDEIVKGTKMFHYCHWLWQVVNDYEPRQLSDPTAGVKQAREEYAMKQMGILPVKDLE